MVWGILLFSDSIFFVTILNRVYLMYSVKQACQTQTTSRAAKETSYLKGPQNCQKDPKQAIF